MRFLILLTAIFVLFMVTARLADQPAVEGFGDGGGWTPSVCGPDIASRAEWLSGELVPACKSWGSQGKHQSDTCCAALENALAIADGQEVGAGGGGGPPGGLPGRAKKLYDGFSCASTIGEEGAETEVSVPFARLRGIPVWLNPDTLQNAESVPLCKWRTMFEDYLNPRLAAAEALNAGLVVPKTSGFAPKPPATPSEAGAPIVVPAAG